MGLRPHPPRRPPNPGDLRASTLLANPCGSHERASTRRQPRFHGSGAGRRCRPAPPSGTRHRREPALCLGLRERRTDDGASPQPDPLGHLSSRNRGSTGWRLRCCTTPPSRSRVERLRRSRRTNPAFAIAHEKRRARVTTAAARSRGPAVPDEPTRSACAHPAGTPGAGWAGPLAQSRTTWGRGPLHPILREEDRDPPHPRCLPSMSHPCRNAWAFARDAGLSPRFVRRVGRSPQVVTNLWRTRGAVATFCASDGLDGPTAAKARSPWSAEARPEPAQRRTGERV